MSFKDRIEELRQHQHVNRQMFAEFLRISPATLSSIITGRTKATLNTIMAIKSKFPNLNYGWLIDGVGPMFNDEETSDASKVPSDISATPDGEGLLDFGSATGSDMSSGDFVNNIHQPYTAESSAKPATSTSDGKGTFSLRVPLLLVRPI